jgi:hypothetical protein
VIGPERLLAIAYLDVLERLPVLMGGRKRMMAWRVPVLREKDVLKNRGDTMNHRYYRIAIRHSQCSAGAEVILHVDNDEHVRRTYLHGLGARSFTLFVTDAGILPVLLWMQIVEGHSD